ncbi:MAG: two-component system response regulator CreB [bacterium]
MKLKILIIEDEPAIADTITYALKTEGFDPIWSTTGKEGKEIIERGDIALIILDIGLPDINGFELCKDVRTTSSVPIIFLTARSEEIDRVVGLEIGADDYVVKPFSPRELTARVKAILRRTTVEANLTSPSSHTISSSFTIDEDRLRISYCSIPLKLTRYEYNILSALIKRPGKVFSRDELMEIAWDEPEASMDRTVDAHIKSIRRKIRIIKSDDDPIETRPGFGYALKEEK